MRVSKELRKRAKRRKNERALVAELKRKSREWLLKNAKANKHGQPLPPGGILYLTQEMVFLGSVQEWILITAKKLEIHPQCIRVQGDEASAGKPDLTMKTLPGMMISIPEAWFDLKGVGKGNEPEARKLMNDHLKGMVSATTEEFQRTVRRRYEILGYPCEPLGSEGN
jgi:hypothetical protein